MGLRQVLAVLIALQAMATWGADSGQQAKETQPLNEPKPAKTHAKPDLNLPFSVETEHYIVRTDISQRVADNAARAMENLYKQFELIFKPDASAKNGKKVEIGLFRSQDDFIKHSQEEGGKPTDKTLGFFIPYRDGSGRILVYKRQDEYNTLNTMYHEATHQFIDMVVHGKDIPLWLNEGLAVYFENSRFENGKFATGLLPRERLKALKDMIRHREFIPLPDLYTRTADTFDGDCYAEAWALVHFFAQANNGAYTKRFNAYFKMLRAGNDPEEAFQKCFPKAERLEPEIKKYVMELRIPTAN